MPKKKLDRPTVARSSAGGRGHLGQTSAPDARKIGALLATFQIQKMNILQCQEAAKELGFDRATFDLCGPKGRVKAKWLDAYFGFFQIDGSEGFIMASQFQFAPDVWCENLTAAEKA